jgi:hypothetical protein
MKSYYGKLFLLSALVFCFLTSNIYTQEEEWVETEGRVFGANITPEEGRKKALDDARSEAIKIVVGVKVSQETFGTNYEKLDVKNKKNSEYNETFQIISRSSSNGKITKEEIISETTQLDKNTKIPVYIVKIRALVAREEGKPDKSFTAELEMNNESNVYMDRNPWGKNDAMEVYIKTSKDCYIYLFNRLENDSIIMLFPNERITDNYFKKSDEKSQFMDIFKGAGLGFGYELPEGVTSTTESLYLIACKEQVEFTSENMTLYAGTFNRLPNYKAAMLDIMNWLVQIPLDERTAAMVSYEIRKAKK